MRRVYLWVRMRRALAAGLLGFAVALASAPEVARADQTTTLNGTLGYYNAYVDEQLTGGWGYNSGTNTSYPAYGGRASIGYAYSTSGGTYNQWEHKDWYKPFARFDVTTLPAGSAVTKATVRHSIISTDWGVNLNGADYTSQVRSWLANPTATHEIDLFPTSYPVQRVDSVTFVSVDVQYITPPTSLATNPGSTTVALSWNANGNTADTTYEIFRNGISIWTGTGTTFTDSGLTMGQTYSYQVRAVDSGVFTAFSNTATVTTVVQFPSPTFSSITTSSYTVNWLKITGGTYTYELWDADSNTTVYQGAATSYAVSGVSPGTKHSYKVRAKSSSGVYSAFSPNGVVVTTPPAPTGTTGGLGWSRSGRGYVVINIPAVPGVYHRVWVFDGYAYRSFDAGASTVWDSRVARVYPDESYLNGLGTNTQTADLFNHSQGGGDLRDRPQDLYRVTAGSTYDAASNYWFRLSAYDPVTGAESPMGNTWAPTLPDQTDTVAPELSFSINNGSATTTTTTVQLDPDYSDDKSGVSQLQVSNDGSIWATFSANSPLTWTVAAGPGSKTVYVRAVDQAGNISSVVTQTIYVDYQALPPSGQGPTGSVTSSSGIPGTIWIGGVSTPTRFVNTTAVTLSLTTEGVAGTRYSFDGITWSTWDQPQAIRTITLPAGDAPLKAIYVQYENQFGFWSQPYMLYFTVDTTAPSVMATWLGNATATANGSATLVLSANDNITPRDSLQVSTDGGSTWVPYSSRINVTFTQPGWQDFTVMVRDQAGNVSGVVLQIYN